jgi:mediator of RNA polymerase II transcription subunit 10
LTKILPTLREAAAETEAADKDGSNTTIPVDVLRHVDEGREPARFMSDSLLAVGEVNKTTMGKANVFRKFHEELVREDEKQLEGSLQAGAAS